VLQFNNAFMKRLSVSNAFNVSDFSLGLVSTSIWTSLVRWQDSERSGLQSKNQWLNMSPFQLPDHIYFSNQFYTCVNFNFISACQIMIRDAAPNPPTCLPFDQPTICKTLNGWNSVVILSPRSTSLHLLIQANAGNNVVNP